MPVIVCPHCLASATLAAAPESTYYCPECDRPITVVSAQARPSAGGPALPPLPSDSLRTSPIPPRPAPLEPILDPVDDTGPQPGVNQLVVVAGLAAVGLVGLLGLLAAAWFFLSAGSKPASQASTMAKKDDPPELVVGEPVERLPKLPEPVLPKKIRPEPIEPKIFPASLKPEPIQPVELAGAGISKDWFVLLRSHDPSIWNQEVNKGPSHLARLIATAPADVRFLRIRRNQDYVIMPMTKDNLLKQVDTQPFGWEGTNHTDSMAYHLGIFDAGKRADQRGAISIRILPWYAGWGFGHIAWVNEQGYCWAGEPIPPIVLEIAVKAGELTAAETENLVRRGAKAAPIQPATLAGPHVSKGWQVLFRSADPSIWNQNSNAGANRFAAPLSTAPDNLQYLRIRKDADYVIVPMTKERLNRISAEEDVGWEGRSNFESNAHHLGVYRPSWRCRARGEIAVASGAVCRGWGFGHGHFQADGQFYSWEGQQLPATTFEIAVTPGPLTAEEMKKVLK